MFKINKLIITIFISLCLNACSSYEETRTNELKKKNSSEIAKSVSKNNETHKPKLKTITSFTKPKPKKIYPPLNHLKGLSHHQVVKLLGKPDFQREDDPALFWQYQTKLCSLDVFLYRRDKKSKYQVNHFETRTKSSNAVESGECFILLLKAYEKSRSS
ncbi:MAG: hypothetical protein VX923_06775 [Pseudomonadota bacterium]|nr:hypothetical protein [Pseudomonadota bacterium]